MGRSLNDELGRLVLETRGENPFASLPPDMALPLALRHSDSLTPPGCSHQNLKSLNGDGFLVHFFFSPSLSFFVVPHLILLLTL